MLAGGIFGHSRERDFRPTLRSSQTALLKPDRRKTKPSNGVFGKRALINVNANRLWRILAGPEAGNRQGPSTSGASILSLGLGILMASVAGHALAERQVRVGSPKEVELAAAPSKTWDTIKDFNRWQEWHPAFASTAITKGDGNTRAPCGCLTTKDGAQVHRGTGLVQHRVAVPTSTGSSNRLCRSRTTFRQSRSSRTRPAQAVVWSSNFKVKAWRV